MRLALACGSDEVMRFQGPKGAIELRGSRNQLGYRGKCCKGVSLATAGPIPNVPRRAAIVAVYCRFDLLNFLRNHAKTVASRFDSALHINSRAKGR